MNRKTSVMAVFSLVFYAGFVATCIAAPAPVSKPDPAKSVTAKPFGFANVHRRAAKLAAKPYKENGNALPDALRDMSYDQYRDIRFKPDKALWRDVDLPFEAQFFFRGFLFQKQVKIHTIDQGVVTPVDYSNDLFNFGKTPVPKTLSPNLGFAGFRLHYPLHRDNYYDEVAVFLGASYFRAVGQEQHYGISLRGLAIDTGLPTKEEFPVFKEFWIQKPNKSAKEITVYALLDSPSVTGAYEFIIQPGAETTIDVKARIFTRTAVKKLGVAPLTSMFLHGEPKNHTVDDYRPEVHDSDGLLLAAGNDEWIWRPLENPENLRISSFQTSNPKGFGLLQRDRKFEHYQDLESKYQRRPSAWVEPIGNWGEGTVELVEIPSDSEKNDNIVAFWVPSKPIEAGQKLRFDYRLSLELEKLGQPPAGKVMSTRIGAGGTVDLDPKRRKFVLDFAGKALEKFGPDTPINAIVSASSGKIENKVVQYNEHIGGWRVYFELIPEKETSIELRSFLKLEQDILTETWSYQWNK